MGQRERQKAQILQQPAPCGYGRGGRVGNALVVDTAAISVVQKEDEEQGVDEEDIFYRIVFFLAAITRGLFSRVLGTDDPSFRHVMDKRGASGVATRTGSSSSGATMVAASASETLSRWARALRERAGVSPRVRSAASSAGTDAGRNWLVVGALVVVVAVIAAAMVL